MSIPMTPEQRFARAMGLLRRGRFKEGWAYYEARAEAPGTGVRRPEIPFAAWRGEALRGQRLLIWPEQGLGDKIMFARWFRILGGADVTVLCEPALVRLFEANFPVRVVAASGRADFPDPDVWALYGSLPYLTGCPEPTSEPFIHAAPVRTSARIGICARGSPQHPNDFARSLPGPDADRLAAFPGAMSLHVDDTGARDFLETAGIIAGLDLVITVDTAVAHLAGAMGKPVWILLPARGLDWRWGLSGATTPWYSSAMLFRQRSGEPWSAVLDRIEGRLSS